MPMRPGNDLKNPRSRRGDTIRTLLGFWVRDRNIGKMGSPLGKSRRKTRKEYVPETIKLAGSGVYMDVVRDTHVAMCREKGRGGDDAG